MITQRRNPINNPIMIVCAGRSGSTFFYRILARHKDLGWLSTYNQRVPAALSVSVASRLYRYGVFDRVRDAYWFPKPFAPYKFWKHWGLTDIARHDRPLFAADVPANAIEPLRRAVAQALWFQGKPRFLMKVTGWARMEYFDRIFPGMRWVHLRRRPIDVMASWVQAGWLNVTGEVGTAAWEWGDVPQQYVEIYRQLGGGPLLSAAVKTQLDVDDLKRNVALFPHRVYELDYEQLVNDPYRYFRELLEFCDLEWTRGFEKVIESAQIRNYTEKWRKILSPEDGERVLEFFARADAVSIVTHA